MKERLLLRNASRRSSGNGCAPSSCVPALLVFTRATQLADKVKKLAGKTHKDRVHEFNSKLESLSEHHDIPKVNIAGIFSTPPLIASSLRLVLDKVGTWNVPECPRGSSFLMLCVGYALLVDVMLEPIPLHDSYPLRLETSSARFGGVPR
jgi:hypothetical protein